jgi:hypothetical protein
MQNANLTPAGVTVSLYSSTNVLLGTSTVTLPSGNRLTREISEMVQGAAPVFGSYVVVSSSLPIQMFGFSGDNVSGMLTPFTAVLTRP